MRRVCLAFAWLGLNLAPFVSSAETPPPLADYLKDWSTDWVRLSPKGDRLAFIDREDGKHQLIVQSPDGTAANVFNIGEANISGAMWAGEDHLIILIRTVGMLGRGFVQDNAWITTAMVVNLKTKTEFRIFDHQASRVGGIVEGFFGSGQIEGHWYGYFGGFNQQRQVKGTGGTGTRRDLYRVDLDSGETTLVSEGSDQGDNWLVSPSGEIVARYKYQWSSGRWQVLAGAYGNKVLASGQSSVGNGGGLQLGQFSGEILFTRPSDSEGLGTFQTLSLSGAPPAGIPDSDQIESNVADRQTGLWIGSVRRGDKPEAHFFSEKLEQKITELYRAFPNRVVTLKSWSTDLDKVIAFTSGSSDSGTYYLVDLTKGRANPVGYTYPEIRPRFVGPVQVIDYRAGDGMDLHAVLSLPPGREAKSLPLVVIPHDSLVGRAYPDFHSTAQAFASRGYAVLEPSPRGSNYGDEYIKAGYGEWGRKIQTDLSDGVADLARRGLIDPKRVCIVGWRWGGYAALAGVTNVQGTYRCAVSVRGISDLNLALIKLEQTTAGPNNVTRSIQKFIGVKSASAREIRNLSPVNLASRADAPILLIYNKDDPSEPGVQSRNMENALKRAGKPVEIFVTSGLKNDTETEANRLDIVEHAVAFVERYNPADGGTARPDPKS